MHVCHDTRTKLPRRKKVISIVGKRRHAKEEECWRIFSIYNAYIYNFILKK